VKDATGAVLPGVEITATQTDTNQTRFTLTDETGAFVLPSLVTGPYRLEASLPGFRTFVQSGIVLGVNQNPTINVVLEVGQVTEQVEVQANATMVETRNLGVRQVIENNEILELPLNGRSAIDLILLQGGSVATGSNSSTRAIQGGVGVSLTGLADGTTTYTLDGALHNNPYDSLNLPMPFPDALQEFSIQTGSQNASNGFLGGAQIAAVTKSGTNEFHGDVFDYYRNDRFQARRYFDTSKGTRRRNQWGGTIGGPILRNKLFFFGGFQYTSNSQNPTASSSIIPTPRMLAGDFSEIIKVYTDSTAQIGGCRAAPINNTGTGATPGLLRLTDSPNYIDPARFSRAALAIVRLLPQVNGMKDDPIGATHLPLSLRSDNPMQSGHGGPIGTDECGRVFFAQDTGDHNSQIIGRIDYQRSERHQIFGRIFLNPQVTDTPAFLEQERLGFLNPLNTSTNGTDNLGSFYTIGDTYLFGPNTVNTVSLAFNRTVVRRPYIEAFDVNDVGINAYTYLARNFFITFPGGAGFSVQGGTQIYASHIANQYSLNDTMSLIRGAHQISLGGSLAHWRDISHGNVRSVPNFSFSPAVGDLTSTGLPLADFLLGKFSQMRQSAPNHISPYQWYVGLHAADTWRLASRLTLNAGVRWEPFFPQQQHDGHIYNFDYQRMLNGVRSQVFLNAPPGFTYPGDPGFPNDKAGMNKKWATFGPRIGLGWDPRGDGRTSIRASYGLSYAFVNGQFPFNINPTAPFGNDTIITSTGRATLENPWADFPGGPGFTPGVSPFPYDNTLSNKNVGFAPGGVFLAVPPDQPVTYIQSWNFVIQRELPQGVFLSVQYTGNGTRHLWSSNPLNPAIFVPGTGASTGGCMVPDGRGGTHSLLVAAGTVGSPAAARTSTAACSTTANTNFRRILTLTRNVDVGPYVADLDTMNAGSNSNYHGLVVSLRRQATSNLNLTGNYTWSRCITDPGMLVNIPNTAQGNTFVSINGQAPGTPSTAFFDPNGNFLPGINSLTATEANRDWNRGNCSTDRRHKLNTTAVVATPQFSNRILRTVLTGWRISSISSWSTGSYLTTNNGTGATGDVARIGGNTGGQVPVQLLDYVYTAGKPSGPRAQYLNRSAFGAPATGTFAPNHGQRSILGPSTWQWDASISRTFTIREGQRLEFRAEAYNVTNSFRPENPILTITDANFGIINQSKDPRDLQFALRYIF
jgi:hypothetical protein